MQTITWWTVSSTFLQSKCFIWNIFVSSRSFKVRVWIVCRWSLLPLLHSLMSVFWFTVFMDIKLISRKCYYLTSILGRLYFCWYCWFLLAPAISYCSLRYVLIKAFAYKSPFSWSITFWNSKITSTKWFQEDVW